METPAHIEELVEGETVEEEKGQGGEFGLEELEEGGLEQETEEEDGIVVKQVVMSGEEVNVDEIPKEPSVHDQDSPPKINTNKKGDNQSKFSDIIYSRVIQSSLIQASAKKIVADETKEKESESLEELNDVTPPSPYDTSTDTDKEKKCAQCDPGQPELSSTFESPEKGDTNCAEFKDGKSVLQAFIDKMAENYMKLNARSLIVAKNKIRKIEKIRKKDGQEERIRYSSMAKLGKMIADRINSRGDLLVKSKKIRPCKPSNLNKIDKKHFR